MTLMAPTEMLGLPYGRALTREDMVAMPDDGHRYELIDGTLIVSPAPRIRHQDAALKLLLALNTVVSAPWKLLFAPVDVVLADDTVIQPDLLVADQADFTEHDLPTAPLLAVEILSPSSRNIDLLLKKERLQRAGCAHYWVVDPDQPAITAWTLTDGRYQQTAQADGDGDFTVAEPFALTIALTDLTS